MGSKPSENLIEKEIKSKPGPGMYDPNTENFLKKSPSTKIGTSLRDDLAFKKQN